MTSAHAHGCAARTPAKRPARPFMKILDEQEQLKEDRRPSFIETPDVSVFLPVFNEEPNLRPLHAKLDEALKSLGRSAEIVYVDDGSSDDSLKILREIAQMDPRVRVVALRRNYGQTAAMAAGIDAARGKVRSEEHTSELQ